MLVLAMLVMFAGMGLLAYFPRAFAAESGLRAAPVPARRERWQMAWIVLAILTCWRCLRCVVQPASEFVQDAVRQCLISLIIFDAALTVAVRDIAWGIGVLLLLVPMTVLGRWSYST